PPAAPADLVEYGELTAAVGAIHRLHFVERAAAMDAVPVGSVDEPVATVAIFPDLGRRPGRFGGCRRRLLRPPLAPQAILAPYPDRERQRHQQEEPDNDVFEHAPLHRPTRRTRPFYDTAPT